ncbi:MAG: pilus assembly protein PilP [bacterium]
MRSLFSHRLLLAAVVALVAAGCEEELQAPPPKPPAKEEQKVEEVPTPEVSEASSSEYVRPEYPNSQRRNPFQPDPEVVTPQARSVEGEVRELEPLEQYALGQLKLMAIISEVAVPIAMFRDPTGFGHFVKEGDRIGRNSGVISDIRDNEVEVLEGGDDEDSQTLQRIVRLRDTELSTGDSGLSDEEKAALERLLQTDEGRKALQRTFEDNAAGANAVEQQQQEPTQSGGDPRFGGFAPPAEN